MHHTSVVHKLDIGRNQAVVVVPSIVRFVVHIRTLEVADEDIRLMELDIQGFDYIPSHINELAGANPLARSLGDGNTYGIIQA